MKKRILSIDILRGLGIMVIIVIHRLHYHWTGMQSKEVLREYFHSGWAPLLIAVIIMFSMAGIFYFISGIVNAYSFYKNVEHKGIPINKVVTGGVIGGIWILLLNYIHKLFFANGFTLGMNGLEPDYPVGFIVGWIRNPHEVQFYWSQITEPGTLAVIGLVVIIVSLILGILLQPNIRKNKNKLFTILITLGFISLLTTPFLKYIFRPAYEEAYQVSQFGKAFFVGHLCKEFSLSPYLGYGFFGAVIGLALAMNEKFQLLRKRNWIFIAVLFVLGLAAILSFNREDTFGEWVIGAGITYTELAIFIFILTFLLKRIDFNANYKNSSPKYKFTIMRQFGMVALTVYFLEPTVAELALKAVELIVGNIEWTNQIYWVLLFGLFLLALWTLILHFWKKVNFAGSLEWLSVKLLYLVAKKRSEKTEFDSIK